MNTVAVIAENYTQFQQFIRDRLRDGDVISKISLNSVMAGNDTEYRYISEPERAFGFRFNDVVEYGTPRRRKDFFDILEAVEQNLTPHR